MIIKRLTGIYTAILCALVILLTLGMITIRVDANDTEYQAKFLSDKELWKITKEVADKYEDVDAALLFSLVEAESAKNIYAINGTHKGLTQVTAKWHQDRMDKLGVKNLYDPYGNVLVCADYLSELLEIAEKKGYGKNIEYALMRYNMATDTANALFEKGIISDYAKKVTTRARELRYSDEELDKWKQLEENMEIHRTSKELIQLANSIGSPYLLELAKKNIEE